MAVRKVGDRWTVDFRFVFPDGTRRRIRETSPVNTRKGAEDHERQTKNALLAGRRGKRAIEIPTFKVFAPKWIEGHAIANRQKPSTIRAKRVILERHILPTLGQRRLDDITPEDVQLLKGKLAALAPKTVNNILVVLSGMLRIAVEWRILPAMPVEVKLVPAPKADMRYFTGEQFERIVEGAAKAGPQHLVVVLLGGEAGLRVGEIQALRWSDVDLVARSLTVRRNLWRGIEGSPKGGRERSIPLTARLVQALRALRHLRGDRVLVREDGSAFTSHAVAMRVATSQRRGGFFIDRKASGEVHILRHTFCSRLAMLGAPARAIQELAGHASLSTTQRYMHLSPSARESAIHLLEGGSRWAAFGQREENEPGVGSK